MPVVQFFCWLLLVWGAGWLFFPVSRRFFETILPDAGLAVGRILFLALWTLCAFWLGNAHVPVAWSAGLYLVFALVGGSFWLKERELLRGTVQRHRRGLWSVEAIFLGVFFFFFAMRGFWSDTNGTNGEKSMDNGLIASIARAQYLPPANFYAAGSRLQSYYYAGHLSAALLTRAAFVPTRWSYNWMCATIPALCFSALFALGAALTGRLKGGAFVMASVLTLGTLQPLIQWLRHRGGAPFPADKFLRLEFFDVSRVIPYSINEFPWFTFNQGDLHAHYFSFTLQIALMSLAWALFRRFSKPLALLTGLILGTLAMTNTWDVPMYSILVLLALFVAAREGAWTRLRLGGGVVILAVVVALPFLLRVKSPASLPHLLQQPASPLREWLLLWGPMLAAWWLHGAKFITAGTEGARSWRWIFVIATSWIAFGFYSSSYWIPPNSTPWWTPADSQLQSSFLVLPIILGSVGLALVGMRRLRGEYRFICVMACAGLGALVWNETTWAGFLGGAEHLGFDDYKRQDTVFKFGLQAWMLWGTASAAGLWLTLNRLSAWQKTLASVAYAPVAVVMLLGSISVLLGRADIIFVPESSASEFHRVPQFKKHDAWDGWAHLAPTEQAAAQWLQARCGPDDFILEAEQKDGGDYTEMPRYAPAIGISTLVGPQAHTFQWAPLNSGDGGKEFGEVLKRKADARLIYTTRDVKERERLLSQYHIRYVMWGELERREYPDATLGNLHPSHLNSARLFGDFEDPRYVEIYEFDTGKDWLF